MNILLALLMVVPLYAAEKPWRFCVALPHAKDRYWWAVAYGLKDEAEKKNVKIEILLADGYSFLEQQKKQILQCKTENFDAIILGGISRDGLASVLEEVRVANIPVVDLVNGVNSSAVVAKSTVNYLKVTDKIFDFILQHAKTNKVPMPISIVVFPGPKGAGWSEDTYAGFRAKMKNKNVRISFGGFDDTGIYQQMSLVRGFFVEKVHADYIVANGVAALAASRLFEFKKIKRAPYIISTYETDEIVAAVKEGKILATSTEKPVTLARKSIDLAIEAVEKKLSQSQFQRELDVQTKESLENSNLEESLPKSGFFFDSNILKPSKNKK
ncbi:TMAO reductase system periplasmic protein TorT [Bdellovibrio sp. HCB337]|uniref:TMAO reductase system periplasmic protein TorT n=1 Tax=Bdellovibrio sp. HCB337 TaxID=3394358 RepID=UPI0039A5D26A